MGFCPSMTENLIRSYHYSEQIKEATITSVDFYAKRQSMYDADYSNQRKNKSKGLKYILILIIYRSSEILI